MTSRSSRPIICECGHKGAIDCAENDAPFTSLWEEYTLDGFSGKEVTVTVRNPRPENMIEALAPLCPACGEVGKVSYLRA